jgi:TRAP-type C4-dicarboxylate transport system substrate-binding protein
MTNWELGRLMMKICDLGTMRKQLLASALALGGALFLFSQSNAGAAETNLRVSGLVSTHKYHVALEREFYGTLAKKTGLDVSVNYNPLDVLGVSMKDTLRLVRKGTFDIVETTAGEAARDDAFLEGLDLIGVSPSLETLKQAVEAYRGVFSERVESRFNVKVMSLWPYGPQVFYCKPKIKGLTSLKGLKVRSYTPSMSALISALGGTPVALSFKEVYTALQRGVADCSITSPTSGNTGNWPEVTTHYLPLGISWSINAHFMNMNTWNKLSSGDQKKLAAAYRDLEAGFWNLAKNNTGDADSCNVGGPCKNYKKFNMTLVKPTAADEALLAKASSSAVLPTWAETCKKVKSDCVQVWNATVGKARGLTIK